MSFPGWRSNTGSFFSMTLLSDHQASILLHSLVPLPPSRGHFDHSITSSFNSPFEDSSKTPCPPLISVFLIPVTLFGVLIVFLVLFRSRTSCSPRTLFLPPPPSSRYRPSLPFSRIMKGDRNTAHLSSGRLTPQCSCTSFLLSPGRLRSVVASPFDVKLALPIIGDNRTSPQALRR